MPSTRRQKAKTRKSREMDMMSDMDNLDVMLGNGSENPIERELTEVIEQSSVRSDSEANLYQRDEYRNFSHENSEYRQNDVRQSFETFSNEFNLRLSQEMDSMMAMVHSQINRAISTAISEKVLPEIQNIVSSMSSSGNRDTEASMSPSSQENRENSSGLKTKLLKKDSRSVGDLRDTTGRGSYTTKRYLTLLHGFISISLFREMAEDSNSYFFCLCNILISNFRISNSLFHVNSFGLTSIEFHVCKTFTKILLFDMKFCRKHIVALMTKFFKLKAS